MAHLTIQIGASIVIPMPKRLSRNGRRVRRLVGARLRWQAIQEAAILGRFPNERAWETAATGFAYRDNAMRHALLAKKGKVS